MKDKKWNILSIVFTSLRILLVTSLIILLTIRLINKNNDEHNLLTTGQIIIIIISFIFLILINILLSLFVLITFIFSDNFNFIKLFILALLTLNFEIIIHLLLNIKKYKNTKIFMKETNKWNIFNISIISLLLGLYLIIDFISSFIPTLPFWISLSIKYVILYFAAFIMSFFYVFILCFIIGLLTLIMPGTSVMSPFQYLFDYFIPILAFSVAYFFRPVDNVKNKQINILQWTIFVIMPMLIVYFSRVISGVVFWLNPNVFDGVFFEFSWTGSVFAYSMIYNLFNSIIDCVILIIFVPLICIPLRHLRLK